MDLLDAIQRTKPCRSFQPRPIPEDMLTRVLNAARMAPSVDNQQPWRFLVIRDEGTKDKLSQVVTKGTFVRSAPVVVVAIAAEGETPSLVGGYVLGYLLDVAISIDHLALAATSEGLGACWLTEFKADKISKMLSIPEGFHVVGVVPLGFPSPEANDGKQLNGRKSLAEVTAYERFNW